MATDSVSPIQQSSQEENENALDLLHPGYDGIQKLWGSSCKGWSKQTLAAGLHVEGQGGGVQRWAWIGYQR